MIENDMAIKLLPTLLEVLALFYFAEHFLTAKVSKIKRYIANICFYLLDCGAIYAFQENSAIKYAVVILLIFLWAKYVYRVTVINGVFLSIFQFSYWMIMDSLFVSIALSFGENKNDLLDRFILLYILIKAAELIVIVGVCRIGSHHKDVSWRSSLRILAFPVCLMCVSFYLFSIMIKEPQYAARLLNCIMLLMVIDIFSIYLLEYLEKQQYNAALYASLKQN